MSVPTPHEIYGPLFVAVQEARLFADSKAFADAIPNRAAADILADWHRDGPFVGDRLRAFVAENFTMPPVDPDAHPSGETLHEHIDALWSKLTRETRDPLPNRRRCRCPNPMSCRAGGFANSITGTAISRCWAWRAAGGRIWSNR